MITNGTHVLRTTVGAIAGGTTTIRGEVGASTRTNVTMIIALTAGVGATVTDARVDEVVEVRTTVDNIMIAGAVEVARGTRTITEAVVIAVAVGGIALGPGTSRKVITSTNLSKYNNSNHDIPRTLQPRSSGNT